jgi:hypothetical protein
MEVQNHDGGTTHSIERNIIVAHVPQAYASIPITTNKFIRLNVTFDEPAMDLRGLVTEPLHRCFGY